MCPSSYRSFFDRESLDHSEKATKWQKLNEAVKQNMEMAQQKQMYYDAKLMHGAATCFPITSRDKVC